MRGHRLLALPRRTAVGFAVLGNVVPVAIAVATDFRSHRPVFFVGAVCVCLAPIVVTAASRRHPIPFYLAAYGGLAALTLLQSYTAGVASGYSVLTMMAMIWFGLQATDRELIAAAILLAACSYLPMLIVGPPAYPVDLGHATLLVIIGLSVAGTLRALARETAVLTDRLREEAVIDELTGLLNRRGWRKAAARELQRAHRNRKPVTLVTLDLDRLKHTNDTLGHAAGDRVLRETADRMRAALRAGDILARVGGDEFVVLLTDSTSEGVVAALERLREATPPSAAFSAGIASWNEDEELDELLNRSDMALYAAKTAGGGTTKIAPRPLALVASAA
jgi:diguanylate cyclase (GGDEF)-like protein